MAKRTDLGDDWAEVVRVWCAGETPAVDADRAWDALAAVERHHPDALSQVIDSAPRGPWRIAALVHLGNNFACCERLEGFEGLAHRMRAGDEGATSELAVAAHLVRSGLVPILEPILGRNKLDALVEVEGEPIFLEVVNPQLSQPMRQAFEALEGVAGHLLEALAMGERLEVLLDVEPDSVAIVPIVRDGLVGVVRDGVTIHSVASLGSVRLGPVDVAEAGIPVPGDREVLVVSAFSLGPAGKKVATVRYPVSDERAQRVLYGESHQFSRDYRNVLVMDLSAVVGGFRRWPGLVARQLQPTRNRRFGAVLFLLVSN